MNSLFQTRIETEPDTHVHISITADQKPPIDIDISNKYGRRKLSVRTQGLVIGSLLLDVGELFPISYRIERFCPYCGEELNLTSSVDRHECITN